MREINKDLKGHFKVLVENVNLFMKQHGVDKENVDENDKLKTEMLAQISVLISEYKDKATYDKVVGQELSYE